MKVKDLKEILESVDDELVVYVYADHGQSTMVANYAGIEHVESLEYFTSAIAEEDLDDHPDAVKIFEIAN